MDREWVARELSEFIERATVPRAYQDDTDLQARYAVVQKILDRTIPNWPAQLEHNAPTGSRWWNVVQMCLRARSLIERHDEIETALGVAAPVLSSASLHPWVWEAARTYWETEHYSDAVSAAAKSLNARLQQKLGRRDVSEGKLVQEAFSLDPPAPEKARLRLMEDDGSKTFTSLHGGYTQLGMGAFMALRNPFAHEIVELDDVEALEQLATFSVLARAIDRATVDRADQSTPPRLKRR